MKKISSRERTLLFLTIGAGIFALLYIFVFEGWFKAWRNLETEILLRERRLSSALETIERTKGAATMWVSVDRMASLIERIDRLSKESGTQIRSIEPLEIEEENLYRRLKVGVREEGDLYSLTNLLYRLKLEKLSVRRLNISSKENNRLEAHLLVSSLAFKDQLTKELEPKKGRTSLDPYYRQIVERPIFGSLSAKKEEPLEIEIEKEEVSVPQGPPTKDLLLKGIVFDGENFLAIIEDRLTAKSLSVNEGDTIKGAKVVKIHPNGVVLQYQEEQFQLIIR